LIEECGNMIKNVEYLNQLPCIVTSKSISPMGNSSFYNGKSNPYVRVFHTGNDKDIVAQTKVIDNDLNLVWNEVHYRPVKNIDL
ncbi:8240_t:CDS:2, partial [Racocetra fulgida]